MDDRLAIDDAEQGAPQANQVAGLLERSGTSEMRVRFTPRFAENFEKLFGALLLVHAACARHALGEIGAA